MNTVYLTATALDNEIKLRGTIYASRNLKGIMSVGGGVSHYEGDYEVVPARYDQVLDTSNKILKKDVTIVEIPYSEVSNLSGGTTFYIARE